MKIAFMYSGQGSQTPGMMEDLYNRYPQSRNIFEKADKALDRSISDLCFSGNEDELKLTHNTQPCVLAADLAAGAALESEGIQPDVVAGFSLGEYGALVRAGVLDISDAFRLVQIRADAMQEAVPEGEGAMAAIIGTTPDEVERLCKESTDAFVIPANYNSPIQTVVSGTVTGVNNVILAAERKSLKAVKLNVSAPFHCKLMQSAANRIRDEFADIQFSDPQISVYMNVNGEAVSDGSVIPDLLYRQAMSAVRWQETLINMKENGVDTFIECGPGKTLWGFARHTLTDVKILRVSDVTTLDKTIRSLKGANG